MRWVRIFVKLGLGLVTLLTGCKFGYGVPAYGMPSPTKDASVEIVDFSYEPAQNLQVGDAVTFTVTLNKELADLYYGVTVRFDGNDVLPFDHNFLWLKDDGTPPDQVARDGIYTHGARLKYSCESIPVAAVYFDLERFADPMTVLPGETE